MKITEDITIEMGQKAIYSERAFGNGIWQSTPVLEYDFYRGLAKQINTKINTVKKSLIVLSYQLYKDIIIPKNISR